MANGYGLREKLGKYSGAQLFFLAFLRIVVGWHFLYEGYVKITSSGWSSAGYLNAVPGPFSGMFKAMLGTPWMLSAIDGTMKYGLTLVGLMLILGLFTRLAVVGATVLLALFYFSNPPWLGVHFMSGEGSYLIVNKNLVELAAVLILLVFPAGYIWGFDRLFARH